MAALVALVATRARLGLLACVAGDDAECGRDAGGQADVLNAAGGLGAYVVEVGGLAANDGADAGDSGEHSSARTDLRRVRELEGARGLVGLDRSERYPSLGEPLDRAADEAIGESS